MKLVASLLLLAAGAGTMAPAERRAIDQALVVYYQPYRAGHASGAVWDRPIFAQDLTALIARWKKSIPEDEPDGLNDGDWLCLCQDWDHTRFRVTTLGRRSLGAGAAELQLRIDLGIGQTRNARLLLRREAGGWKIADLFSSDFPEGLRTALVETTAENNRQKQ